MDRRIGVIGLGNTILTDEGAGVHLARRLAHCWRFTPQIEVRIAETGGIHLADQLAGLTAVLLLDICADPAPPGTIQRVEKTCLLQPGSRGGGHALGLRQALEYAQVMAGLPEDVWLLTIVPAVVGFGEQVSPQLAQHMKTYEQEAVRLLAQLGVQAQMKNGVEKYGECNNNG